MPSSRDDSPRALGVPAEPEEPSSPTAAASAPRSAFSAAGHADALLEKAGLRRSRRSKPAGVARTAVLQGESPEELRPGKPATVKAPNGVEWIPVPPWKRITWLWHGFSTRCGGVTTCYAPEGAPAELNLTFTREDDRDNVLRNRRLLTEAITGSAGTPLVMVRQIHSSVLVLADPDSDQKPCKGDALMTDRPGILIGVQTADCTPVLVADRKRKVVAAFHAGWRGTVKRIVENGIGRMRLEFGSKPEDLIAAVGPGIGPCCYQVGDELVSEFESQFTYGRELFHEVSGTDPVKTRYPMLFMNQLAPGHLPAGHSLHLDVAEANRRQLIDAGLKADAIQMIGGCTSCHADLFFSHRASKGHAGRMLNVIGIAR